MEAVSIAEIEATIEIATHPPGSTIPMPVPATYEVVATRSRFDPADQLEELAHPTIRQDRPGEFGGSASKSIDQPVLRKFISTLIDRTEAVMGKPVLVAIDPDEILERQCHTCFLVRLQLGQIDHEICG